MKLLWRVVTLPVRCHFRLHNRCDRDIFHPGDQNLCTVAVLSSKYSGVVLLGWTRFFLLLLGEKERPARCKSSTYHRYRPILQCYLAAVLLFLLPKRVNKVISVNSITGDWKSSFFFLKSPKFFFVFKDSQFLHGIPDVNQVVLPCCLQCKTDAARACSLIVICPADVVHTWLLYLELFYDFGIKFGYNVAASSQRSLATTTLARLFWAKKENLWRMNESMGKINRRIKEWTNQRVDK